MKIRNVIPEDYLQIHIINELAFQKYYPAEKTKIKIENILSKPTDIIFVAEIDDTVVGYVHVADYELTYYDSMKNIVSIAVNPMFQGKGIGKALLLKAEEWAVNDGACGIRLVSGETRKGAHEFYKKMNYIQNSKQFNFIITLPR